MRDNLMINQNTDDGVQKILDALGDGVAKEETSQEILLKTIGLINAGATVTCTASGNVLLTPINSEILYTENKTVAKYRVDKINGTLRVLASICYIQQGTAKADASVRVTITGRSPVYISTSSAMYETKYLDIAVTDGDVITLEVTRALGDAKVKLLTICGDLSEPTTNIPGIIKV